MVSFARKVQRGSSPKLPQETELPSRAGSVWFESYRASHSSAGLTVARGSWRISACHLSSLAGAATLFILFGASLGVWGFVFLSLEEGCVLAFVFFLFLLNFKCFLKPQ